MKKVLGIVLLVIILTVGCANDTNSTGGSEEGEQNKAANTKNEMVINVTYKEVDGYDEWLEASKAEFEETYPGITVKLSKMSSNEGDYNTKTSLMLQSDDTIDVMVVDSFLAPSLVATGSLATLPVDTWEDWESQYPTNVKEGMTFGGNVYAIPYTTDTRGLYYNVEIFNEVGIETPWQPKSWDDVMATIEQLHEAGISYPIWMNGSKAQGEGTTMQTFEMLLAGTNDWLYEDGKWVVTSQGFLDALTFIEKLHNMGIYENTELATMLDANSWQVLNEKMPASEEVAIALDGNWKSGDWIKALPDTHQDVIKITPMPNRDGNSFASMSGGWTLAVSEMSDAKEEAFNFIQTALNEKNILNFSLAGGDMAVRKDVAQDADYIEQNIYRAQMSEYTEYTKFRPGVEAYPSVSIEIQAAVESVITGQMTAEEAMMVYAENVKSIVNEDEYVSK